MAGLDGTMVSGRSGHIVGIWSTIQSSTACVDEDSTGILP